MIHACINYAVVRIALFRVLCCGCVSVCPQMTTGSRHTTESEARSLAHCNGMADSRRIEIPRSHTVGVRRVVGCVERRCIEAEVARPWTKFAFGWFTFFGLRSSQILSPALPGSWRHTASHFYHQAAVRRPSSAMLQNFRTFKQALFWANFYTSKLLPVFHLYFQSEIRHCRWNVRLRLPACLPHVVVAPEFSDLTSSSTSSKIVSL